MYSSLAPEAVVPRLRGRFGRPYRYVDECASTQRLIVAEDPEGAVAVADHQTGGRGRLGRTWLDEPGTAVLFSLSLRPPLPAARWPELTPLAGQVAAEAIAAVTGFEPAIKAPNDLLIGGLKVAGILAEASEEQIVLGIGVNVSGAPASVPATSLEAATGHEVDRARLLVALLDHLERAYDEWSS